ncbi:hypothetical protein V6N13_080081 [Hibiscus sabdariffa]
MSKQRPIKTIGPTIPSKYLDKRVEDDSDYDRFCCLRFVWKLGNLRRRSNGALSIGFKKKPKKFLMGRQRNRTDKDSGQLYKRNFRKGLVVAWSPQLQVLGHEAVGCFMTHYGGNQSRDGWKRNHQKEEIERCIREIMEGDRGGDIKRNAVKWKKLAMEALNEGGSSDTNITEFIAELALKDLVCQN